MKLVLDAENTVQWIEEKDEDGKVKVHIDLSPFHPDNKLVSYGMTVLDDNDNHTGVEYLFFHHKEVEPIVAVASAKRLQEQLDKTTLLIGHNIKHDLLWLFESGFKYDGPIYDTMIGEYVLARGLKMPFNLAESCERRMVAAKRGDLIEEYWKQRIGFEAMPKTVVEEYGSADIVSTAELYAAQQVIYQNERNHGLIKTRDMMNEFCLVLTDMERNGIFIDLPELGKVEEEYLDEQSKLTARAQELIFEVMGDTPINMGSTEQMSMVVYGRKVMDKARWTEIFNLGTDARGKKKRRPRMSFKQFADHIKRNTVRLRKTKACQCADCKGTGKYFKVKKNGENWSKSHKCKTCFGSGIIYEDLQELAGFGMSPRDVDDVSDGGFATNKNVLARLAEEARVKGNKKAEEFLRIIIRLNAIDTYLNSFCGGIRRHTGYDSILHCHFNQCITATGRLSSSDP